MHDNNLKITQEIYIPAAHETVWEFLLSEEKMKLWFNADKFIIDAIEGGEIRIPLSFQGKEYIIAGEIGLILPRKKFVFTWIEGNKYGEFWFNNTTVIIELEEAGAGTQLSLTHDGFKYLSSEIREDAYRRYVAYWEEGKFMEQLLKLIAPNKK